MRIVIDANLSPRWASFLKEAGFSAVHWSQVGAPDAPDRIVADWALTNSYVVMTNDLDFSAILAATQRDKPSVVQIRSDLLTPDAIGAIILRALAHAAEELDAGALVSIDVTRTRIRILPLGC